MIAMPTKKVTNDICRLYNSEELYAWDCQTAAGCGRDWITPYRVVVKVSCVEGCQRKYFIVYKPFTQKTAARGEFFHFLNFLVLRNLVEQEPQLARLDAVKPHLQLSFGSRLDTAVPLKILFQFVLQRPRHGLEWRVEAKISHVTLSSVIDERTRFPEI